MSETIARTIEQLRQECRRIGIPTDNLGKLELIDLLGRSHWAKHHGSEPMPSQVLPMLVSEQYQACSDFLRDAAPDGSGWVVQPKLDGMRVLVHIEADGRVRITSRRISTKTYLLCEHQDRLPHLLDGLGALVGTILDGELISPSTMVHGANIDRSVVDAEMTDSAEFLEIHLFDTLKVCGDKMTDQPWTVRYAALMDMAEKIDNPSYQLVPSFTTGKKRIHQEIIEAGGEGTVWKKKGSAYYCGKRSREWFKLKDKV